jgi:hypothetical protein
MKLLVEGAATAIDQYVTEPLQSEIIHLAVTL